MGIGKAVQLYQMLNWLGGADIGVYFPCGVLDVLLAGWGDDWGNV